MQKHGSFPGIIVVDYGNIFDKLLWQINTMINFTPKQQFQVKTLFPILHLTV